MGSIGEWFSGGRLFGGRRRGGRWRPTVMRDDSWRWGLRLTVLTTTVTMLAIFPTRRPQPRVSERGPEGAAPALSRDRFACLRAMRRRPPSSCVSRPKAEQIAGAMAGIAWRVDGRSLARLWLAPASGGLVLARVSASDRQMESRPGHPESRQATTNPRRKRSGMQAGELRDATRPHTRYLRRGGRGVESPESQRRSAPWPPASRRFAHQ